MYYNILAKWFQQNVSNKWRTKTRNEIYSIEKKIGVKATFTFQEIVLIEYVCLFEIFWYWDVLLILSDSQGNFNEGATMKIGLSLISALT